MLSGSTFGCDDLSGEWKALTAAGAAAHRRIGAGGAGSAAPSGLAHLAFPNRIADADNHPRLLAEQDNPNENVSQ